MAQWGNLVLWLRCSASEPRSLLARLYRRTHAGVSLPRMGLHVQIRRPRSLAAPSTRSTDYVDMKKTDMALFPTAVLRIPRASPALVLPLPQPGNIDISYVQQIHTTSTSRSW